MAAKKTSRGGIKFTDVCRGKKGYSFKLINLSGVTDLRDAVQKVEQHIKSIISAIPAKGYKRRIKKFYIGKTSTWKTTSCHSLDPTKTDTMIKDNINSRWRQHKKAGKDSMVVVTVITNEVAEALKYSERQKHIRDYRRELSIAENCALDMEKEIQKRFRDDPRLDIGKKYSAGRSSKDGEAFPLYVAFQYWRRNLSFYSFNLCDLSKARSIRDATDMIFNRIITINDDLYNSTGKNPTLSIGHTYVHKSKFCEKLDPMDPFTFNKRGICIKWENYKTESKTRNGMIVVAVITKTIARRLRLLDVGDCAEVIQGRIMKDNSRYYDNLIQGVVNCTQRNASIARCLYITVTFQKVKS